MICFLLRKVFQIFSKMCSFHWRKYSIDLFQYHIHYTNVQYLQFSRPSNFKNTSNLTLSPSFPNKFNKSRYNAYTSAYLSSNPSVSFKKESIPNTLISSFSLTVLPCIMRDSNIPFLLSASAILISATLARYLYSS